jgi:hypothetical protein
MGVVYKCNCKKGTLTEDQVPGKLQEVETVAGVCNYCGYYATAVRDDRKAKEVDYLEDHVLHLDYIKL